MNEKKLYNTEAVTCRLDTVLLTTPRRIVCVSDNLPCYAAKKFVIIIMYYISYDRLF